QPMSRPIWSAPPVTTVMAARTAKAARAAVAAARQPMLRLTASTMVNASTHSTEAVRKAGTKTVQSSMALLRGAGKGEAAAALRRGHQLDEIGAGVPDHFVGLQRRGHDDAARVDSG